MAYGKFETRVEWMDAMAPGATMRWACVPGKADGLDHLLSQSTFATYATRGVDVLVDLSDPEPMRAKKPVYTL